MLANARTPEEILQGRGYVRFGTPIFSLTAGKDHLSSERVLALRAIRRSRVRSRILRGPLLRDQLIDSMAGHYTALAESLRQGRVCGWTFTRRYVMKHLLRQNARAFPGHYHYYVAHVEDHSKRIRPMRMPYRSEFPGV